MRHVYFYAETSGPLTPHTDDNWMLLLIDADQNHDTGWYGYDYLVNKNAVDDGNHDIHALRCGGCRTIHGSSRRQLKYRYRANQLELAVPRRLLGLQGDALTFDFHWCDNPAELNDPISLCINGDSAPNRRFNYRCIWKR